MMPADATPKLDPVRTWWTTYDVTTFKRTADTRRATAECTRCGAIHTERAHPSLLDSPNELATAWARAHATLHLGDPLADLLSTSNSTDMSPASHGMISRPVTSEGSADSAVIIERPPPTTDELIIELDDEDLA